MGRPKKGEEKSPPFTPADWSRLARDCAAVLTQNGSQIVSGEQYAPWRAYKGNVQRKVKRIAQEICERYGAGVGEGAGRGKDEDGKGGSGEGASGEGQGSHSHSTAKMSSSPSSSSSSLSTAPQKKRKRARDPAEEAEEEYQKYKEETSGKKKCKRG